MKVTHNAPPSTQSLENASPLAKTADKAGVNARSSVGGSASSGAASRAANVEISDKARLMKQASEIAMSAPDIRADKVAALKKAIGEGSYQVSSASIADRLVDEHLGTDFGANKL